MSGSRPIIIVTGANNGVGFGICQRLLFQLSDLNPSDAQPRFCTKTDVHERDFDRFDLPCEGLTLVMACRSEKRAEAARTRLYSLLDSYIAKKSDEKEQRHAQMFRDNLAIAIHLLDLSMVSSVMAFAKEIASTYPYISHVICNAGVASFSHIDWLKAIRQFFRGFMSLITHPEFYLEHVGERSLDGLGWVWQCNVFGHYVLIRQLQPLLLSSQYPHDSRVLWMSSIEARPDFYTDKQDWQLLKSECSYECAKYQCDLIASVLDRRALASSESSKRVRHLITHPGICHTSVAGALIGPFLDFVKWMCFYIARWCGSTNHTIDPYSAAISAVCLSIVSCSYLTSSDKNAKPLKYPAQDYYGDPRVGVQEVQGWEEYEPVAEKLVEDCERLYESFLVEEKRPLEWERATEKM